MDAGIAYVSKSNGNRKKEATGIEKNGMVIRRTVGNAVVVRDRAVRSTGISISGYSSSPQFSLKDRILYLVF